MATVSSFLTDIPPELVFIFLIEKVFFLIEKV